MLAKEVRRLAGPAILHSLLQTLVFVVDRIMLGRHGEASLAAMQIGGALEWSIWSVFAAFEVGTIARVGRHVGAGDPASARRAAVLSLVASVGIGSLLALATPFVLDALPRVATRVSPDAIAEARRYLGITLPASPIVFVCVTTIATLQAGGDTRTPLVIGIAANVVHVAMNAILIPILGARGAGISTAMTFVLEATFSLWALMNRSRSVSLRGHSPLGPIRDEAAKLARIALPSFFEKTIYHVGFVGYVFLIARLGDDAMAANQSLISIESICFLSADGFGIAAATLVAQKIGAKKPEEGWKAAWIATRYAIVALTVFGFGAFLLRDVILPRFSPVPHVVAIGREAILVLALAQPFMATGMVLGQALRGAARTTEVLVISILGAVVVRLSATWFFGIHLGMGLTGVWLGSTVDWIARCALLGVIVRRLRS